MSIVVPVHDEQDNVVPLAMELNAVLLIATLDGDGQNDPGDITRLMSTFVSTEAE